VRAGERGRGLLDEEAEREEEEEEDEDERDGERRRRFFFLSPPLRSPFELLRLRSFLSFFRFF
jgi:hypothetical protein